ncbi:mersacidin family lantibiotic [Paenibacillus zanthoxyli]|uniref:mersacidin family lantibiotic n=1 Tax=Paenibacillus zanthoxyli TaxID=369399 RepID=UPI00047167CA|nr:mersacidin family lantibiotic [Paenibacillus zanthoxyli]
MNRKDALLSLNTEDPAGAPLVELSHDELIRVQGGADVQPETTPLCGFFIGVGVGVILSVAKC